jgi:predicted NUDIX family NTP pyrophosphohydrolase
MSRKSEISAGLLAYRRRDQLQVLLAHPGGPYWARRDDAAWTIPKGLTEPGADLLITACREFTEETGFAPDGAFLPLAPVRQKSGKTVHAFAVETDLDPTGFVSNHFEIEWPARSGQRRSFPEIDRLAWFSMPEANRKIIPYQRPFLAQLHQMVASDAA